MIEALLHLSHFMLLGREDRETVGAPFGNSNEEKALGPRIPVPWTMPVQKPFLTGKIIGLPILFFRLVEVTYVGEYHFFVRLHVHL